MRASSKFSRLSYEAQSVISFLIGVALCALIITAVSWYFDPAK